MKNIKQFFGRLSVRAKQPRFLSLRAKIKNEVFELRDGRELTFSMGGPGDVDGLVLVEKACYEGRAPWSALSLLEDINTNRNALYIVAKDGYRPIAFIGCWFVGREAHITNIAVMKEYQRQGVATALLQEAKRIALEEEKEIFTLEVRVSNEDAQALYLKRGFTRGQIKKRYYLPDREDALEMMLDLTKEREDQDGGSPIA